ncbi:pilus assembly protein CpaE [Oryzihumus leptocrescens]|uniref:Pilus assembly protein CpaE n=1 Tax=Oryzihumus leptocrescens TaxID=297536 RepID=A0A542ZGY4_9MICO|nr:pilus assembly protein CpaE [Oryzihumus leptocrescens]TQL59584.1 hypothetical protein FB474_0941 [Oryzihumus leptocrescens]
MISLELAQRLRSAGLVWEPEPGDRFVVPGRDMDDEVFVVSTMLVDVHEFPTGRVIGFNGTTEWALDSIEQHEVVWLPWEHQLRERLGSRFVRLETGDAGFVVVTAWDGRQERSGHRDAECAYAQSLLAMLSG